MTARRRALIVRGGWEGHAPLETTELFLPGLEASGFEVTIAEDLQVYCDETRLAATDLIVQCWTGGTLTKEQSAGLRGAVHAGTGLAGWHGGLVATNAGDHEYLRMVGGLFLFHPAEFLDHRVHVHSGHPVVAGIGDFTVHTEQYWMLSDAGNEVHASTVVDPADGGQGDTPVTMPVVWTRRWGRGRIFFSAIGHRVEDLRQPEVHTLTARGLVWAAR